MNCTPLARREWCAGLAKLVSPAFPADAAAALCDMLPALAHMPDRLFNADTMAHVALAKRRQSIPAFDEIVRALNDWRETFASDPPPRLAPPPESGRLPPTEAEVAAVTATLARHRVEMAEVRVKQAASQPPVRVVELPDVTLKGEALRRSREARGCPVPPAPADGEEREERWG